MVGSSRHVYSRVIDHLANDEVLGDESCRLGIELTKIMVLQYSNQETSVTIGESVRDEDGMDDPVLPRAFQFIRAYIVDGIFFFSVFFSELIREFLGSFHPSINKTQ